MSNEQKDGWTFFNCSIHSRQNNVKSRYCNKSLPSCQSGAEVLCCYSARFWNISKVFGPNLDGNGVRQGRGEQQGEMGQL